MEKTSKQSAPHLGSISKHWNTTGLLLPLSLQRQTMSLTSLITAPFPLCCCCCLNFSYKLNVWDVGGQQTIRSYWRNYFEQTDGLVWVVDSADRMRLEDCKAELQSLLKQERLAGASLLVFANKQDIPGALTEKEIAEVLELDAITTRHWVIQSCSAKTGAGLVEGVSWIVDDISSRIFMLE